MHDHQPAYDQTTTGLAVGSSIVAAIDQIPLNSWIAMIGLAWSLISWGYNRYRDTTLDRLRAENSLLRTIISSKVKPDGQKAEPARPEAD